MFGNFDERLVWLVTLEGLILPPMAGGAPDEDDDEEEVEKEKENPTPDAEDPAIDPDDDGEPEKEPPGLSDEQVKAALDKILGEDDSLLEPHVQRKVDERDRAVKEQSERDEAARPLKEAIVTARTSQDEDERREALARIGEHTLAQITTYEQRKPVEDELTTRFREERQAEQKKDFDAHIDRLGLREFAADLTPEDRSRLRLDNFEDFVGWKYAVIDHLEALKAAAKPGSEKDRAERRSATAERAARGARTPVLQGARGKQDKKSDPFAGMSARDVILGDTNDDE